MRRVFPVAILSALLAVTPAALAQHGGAAGHAGGGFHGGGFSGGHAGFGGFHGGFGSSGGFHGGYAAPGSYGRFAAPRFYGGESRGVPMAPRYNFAPGRMTVYRPAYRSEYRSGAGADHRGWDHRGRGWYGRNEAGYGYGDSYPFINSWELLPWDLNGSDFMDDDTSSGDSQSAAQSEQEPEYESGYQSDSGMPGDGYRQDYAPPPPYEAAPASQPAPIAPEPQLTLIFKDGHTQQVRNYALTQDALLDLDRADAGRVTHIPLASLNLSATEKAAQQAGLDFAPPAS